MLQVIVTAYASVYTLVLMSLDRYLAVVHPISSMSIRTEANTLTAIAVIWVINYIYILLVLVQTSKRYQLLYLQCRNLK